MDDNAMNAIIKANVARARLREMITAISKGLVSRFRSSKKRRAKMKEVLSVLKEHRSYINTADSYGETSMHVAARLDCDMDILQELLKHGGQVDILNGSGESSLHLVARSPQKLDMMRELLKYCQNPNVTNMNGETPLFVALRHAEQDFAMVYELLEHGADFRIADNKNRNSFHVAVRNPYCTIDLIKKFLQEAPTFVNCQDNTNSTPLHGAVRYCNNLEIVKELLDCGADPKVKNKRGRSPLHNAVLKPHAEIVEILLEHGAEVNDLDSSHLTPLHHSLSVDNPDISVIQTLLKHGADINAVNQYDMNVLYVAVCNPTTSYEIVKLFLENGAKPDFDKKSNILVNIDETNRYNFAELLIPYIIIWNINERSTGTLTNSDYFTRLTRFIDQFKAILSVSVPNNSDSYKHFIQVSTVCITEFLDMTSDFICNELSLFQFVSDNCLPTTSHEQNVVLHAIDEVLLRLRDGKYVHCKELIYAAVKHSALVNRLCELKVCYKIPDSGTVNLNSLCINNIAKYLAKDDVIHMIMAFSEKFRDFKCSKAITSKRSTEDEGNMRKKLRK